MAREFDDYDFSGSLRPGTVTPQMTVPAGIPKPDYADTGVPVSEQAADAKRTVTPMDEEGVAAMRKACKIGREVLDIAGKALRVGVTGDEIDKIVYNACVERGGYPSPLNYMGFRKSVCT